MTKRLIVAQFLILLLVSAAAHANPLVPRWRCISTTGPARYAHRCATDINREVVVLFGGKDSIGQMPSNTWEFSRSTSYIWTQYQAAGPQGRIGHGMCYDTANHVTILFGGINQAGQFLNDTWEWNGQSWARVDSTGPAPRGHFAFTYDRSRQRAVLFGGIGPDSLFRDTWEWSGGNWILSATPGPPARMMGSMVFTEYPDSNFCALFGGQAGYTGAVYDDTWKWDGNEWTQLQSEWDIPTPRVGHAMSPRNYGAVYMFGGQNSCSPDSIYGDLWELYGYLGWINIAFAVNPPSPRTQAQLSPGWEFEIMLIGGKDSSHVFSQVWAYPIYESVTPFYVFGDVNRSYSFTGADITYAVRFFKGGPPPPFYVECSPGNSWYIAGDVNGSCTFDGLDVSCMVRRMKSGTPLIPCPECPPIE